MGVAINIVLADAQATPVNHTFIPIGPMQGWDMVFEDQSRSTPIGYWRIYVTMTQKGADTFRAGAVENGTRRIKISLREPVLETIAPAASGLTQPPTIAYEPRVDTEYVVSTRSALGERKDLRKMNHNLQNDPQIVAMVEQYLPVW